MEELTEEKRLGKRKSSDFSRRGNQHFDRRNRDYQDRNNDIEEERELKRSRQGRQRSFTRPQKQDAVADNCSNPFVYNPDVPIYGHNSSKNPVKGTKKQRNPKRSLDIDINSMLQSEKATRQIRKLEMRNYQDGHEGWD